MFKWLRYTRGWIGYARAKQQCTSMYYTWGGYKCRCQRWAGHPGLHRSEKEWV